MPSLVANATAEATLRALLHAEGFVLSAARVHGETGVDILATRGAERLFIEVVGYKSSPPARARDFYEAFFRAISRTHHGAERCVIAIPSQAEIGLPARAKHFGSAWARLGDAFPELEIWLVDVDGHTYRRTQWNNWLSAGGA